MGFCWIGKSYPSFGYKCLPPHCFPGPICFQVERRLKDLCSQYVLVSRSDMLCRIGRKPILLLCVIGLTTALLWQMMVMRFWRVIPYHLVWLSPVFTLIGGGDIVGTMAFYAVISDITQEERRQAFSRIVFLRG